MANESVTVRMAMPRAIAAVRARVAAGRVASAFGPLLDQVYAAARSGAIQLDGQNVFVYRNVAESTDVVDVEFGVGARAPFTDVGPVRYSQLPVGEVATTTHSGDYSRLGDAHNAVWAWCRANGRTPTGVRWEIYGHWTDDPADLRTDVFYLLEPRGS